MNSQPLIIALLFISLLTGCIKDDYVVNPTANNPYYVADSNGYDQYNKNDVALKIPSSSFYIGQGLIELNQLSFYCDYDRPVLFPKCDLISVEYGQLMQLPKGSILNLSLDQNWTDLVINDRLVTYDLSDLKIYRLTFDGSIGYWQTEIMETNQLSVHDQTITISSFISQTGYYAIGIDRNKTNIPYANLNVVYKNLISGGLSSFNFESANIERLESRLAGSNLEESLLAIFRNSDFSGVVFVLSFLDMEGLDVGKEHEIIADRENLFVINDGVKILSTKTGTPFQIKIIERTELSMKIELYSVLNSETDGSLNEVYCELYIRY